MIRAFLSDFKTNLVVRGDGLYCFDKAKAMVFHSNVGEVKYVRAVYVYDRFILHSLFYLNI